MTRAQPITAERLRELLSYDPETGLFVWKIRTSNRIKVGNTAGTISAHLGYRSIVLDGVHYYAHRLAWLHMTDRWPKNEIDHIDQDRSNNAWANLREATHAQNAWNRGPRVTNKSGFRGVSKHSLVERWAADIHVNKKRVRLGLFNSPEEAAAAYEAAAKELREPY